MSAILEYIHTASLLHDDVKITLIIAKQKMSAKNL